MVGPYPTNPTRPNGIALNARIADRSSGLRPNVCFRTFRSGNAQADLCEIVSRSVSPAIIAGAQAQPTTVGPRAFEHDPS